MALLLLPVTQRENYSYTRSKFSVGATVAHDHSILVLPLGGTATDLQVSSTHENTPIPSFLKLLRCYYCTRCRVSGAMDVGVRRYVAVVDGPHNRQVVTANEIATNEQEAIV